MEEENRTNRNEKLKQQIKIDQRFFQTTFPPIIIEALHDLKNLPSNIRQKSFRDAVLPRHGISNRISL